MACQRYILSHGNSNSRGVAILMTKGTDCTIHSKIRPQGRYIILKADIADHELYPNKMSCPELGQGCS